MNNLGDKIRLDSGIDCGLVAGVYIAILMDCILDGVDHGFDPALCIFLQLTVQSFIELVKPGISSRDDDIFKVVVPNRGVCESKAFMNSVRDPLLLQPDILRIKQNLGNLEAFFIQRNMLQVHAYISINILSSSTSTAYPFFFRSSSGMTKCFKKVFLGHLISSTKLLETKHISSFICLMS